LKVYHIAYEPSYGSVDIHIWTKCTLDCRACYTNWELYDFGLYDDALEDIKNRERQAPPDKFLSYDEVIAYLKPLEIKYAVFMGTEAALDPELPQLAKELHEKWNSYNILLTNGMVMPNLEDIDQVIFSLKAYSEDVFKAYTGRSNKTALKNFEAIAKAGKNLHAEVVYIPELIEADEVERVAQFVASVDPNISFRIDAYFPVPECPWRAATNEEVEIAAERAKKHMDNVTILTLDMKRIGDKAVRVY
jgi:pyruvate-formate lyase-activating enzyme